MTKPQGVDIIIKHTSDVTIIGGANRKGAMKNLMRIIQSKAKECGGKVRQKTEFSDGFYLKVIFETKEAKDLFDATIK